MEVMSTQPLSPQNKLNKSAEPVNNSDKSQLICTTTTTTITPNHNNENDNINASIECSQDFLRTRVPPGSTTTLALSTDDNNSELDPFSSRFINLTSSSTSSVTQEAGEAVNWSPVVNGLPDVVAIATDSSKSLLIQDNPTESPIQASNSKSANVVVDELSPSDLTAATAGDIVSDIDEENKNDGSLTDPTRVVTNGIGQDHVKTSEPLSSLSMVAKSANVTGTINKLSSSTNLTTTVTSGDKVDLIVDEDNMTDESMNDPTRVVTDGIGQDHCRDKIPSTVALLALDSEPLPSLSTTVAANRVDLTCSTPTTRPGSNNNKTNSNLVDIVVSESVESTASRLSSSSSIAVTASSSSGLVVSTCPETQPVVEETDPAQSSNQHSTTDHITTQSDELDEDDDNVIPASQPMEPNQSSSSIGIVIDDSIESPTSDRLPTMTGKPLLINTAYVKSPSNDRHSLSFLSRPLFCPPPPPSSTVVADSFGDTSLHNSTRVSCSSSADQRTRQSVICCRDSEPRSLSSFEDLPGHTIASSSCRSSSSHVQFIDESCLDDLSSSRIQPPSTSSPAIFASKVIVNSTSSVGSNHESSSSVDASTCSRHPKPITSPNDKTGLVCSVVLEPCCSSLLPTTSSPLCTTTTVSDPRLPPVSSSTSLITDIEQETTATQLHNVDGVVGTDRHNGESSRAMSIDSVRVEEEGASRKLPNHQQSFLPIIMDSPSLSNQIDVGSITHIDNDQSMPVDKQQSPSSTTSASMSCSSLDPSHSSNGQNLSIDLPSTAHSTKSLLPSTHADNHLISPGLQSYTAEDDHCRSITGQESHSSIFTNKSSTTQIESSPSTKQLISGDQHQSPSTTSTASIVQSCNAAEIVDNSHSRLNNDQTMPSSLISTNRSSTHSTTSIPSATKQLMSPSVITSALQSYSTVDLDENNDHIRSKLIRTSTDRLPPAPSPFAATEQSDQLHDAVKSPSTTAQLRRTSQTPLVVGTEFNQSPGRLSNVVLIATDQSSRSSGDASSSSPPEEGSSRDYSLRPSQANHNSTISPFKKPTPPIKSPLPKSRGRARGRPSVVATTARRITLGNFPSNHPLAGTFRIRTRRQTLAFQPASPVANTPPQPSLLLDEDAEGSGGEGGRSLIQRGPPSASRHRCSLATTANDTTIVSTALSILPVVSPVRLTSSLLSEDESKSFNRGEQAEVAAGGDASFTGFEHSPPQLPMEPVVASPPSPSTNPTRPLTPSASASKSTNCGRPKHISTPVKRRRKSSSSSPVNNNEKRRRLAAIPESSDCDVDGQREESNSPNIDQVSGINTSSASTDSRCSRRRSSRSQPLSPPPASSSKEDPQDDFGLISPIVRKTSTRRASNRVRQQRRVTFSKHLDPIVESASPPLKRRAGRPPTAATEGSDAGLISPIAPVRRSRQRRTTSFKPPPSPSEPIADNNRITPTKKSGQLDVSGEADSLLISPTRSPTLSRPITSKSVPSNVTSPSSNKRGRPARKSSRDSRSSSSKSSDSSSGRRYNNSNQHYCLAFSSIDPSLLASQSVYQSLNATITDDVVEKATHLVTTVQCKRTWKMLVARARNLPLISPNWLIDCKAQVSKTRFASSCGKEQAIPDPTNYLINPSSDRSNPSSTTVEKTSGRRRTIGRNRMTLTDHQSVNQMRGWTLSAWPGVQPPSDQLATLAKLVGAQWIDSPTHLVTVVKKQPSKTVLLLSKADFNACCSTNHKEEDQERGPDSGKRGGQRRLSKAPASDLVDPRLTRLLVNDPSLTCVCVDWFLQLIMNQETPSWPIAVELVATVPSETIAK